MNFWKFIVILILLAPHSVQARVGNIIVEGVDRQTTKDIISVVQPILKDPLNNDTLKNAMEGIFQLGEYQGIDIYLDNQADKTDIIIKIAPIRIFNQISFSGNNKISSSDLNRELGIAEGDSYSAEKVKSAVENIKKFYNLSGFLNAQISADFKINSNSQITMDIKVKEGSPCLIEDIIFSSVNSRLNEALFAENRKYLRKIFTQKLLTDMQSESIQYLYDEKYFTSQLPAPEITFNETKTKVKIKYLVEDPYAFSFVYEGATSFTDTKIFKELKLDSDNKLSAAPLEDINERVTKLYRSYGYANVTVKTRENLYTQEFTRRITINIKEGPRVRIKDVIFDGSISRPQKYYKNYIFEHSSDLIDKGFFSNEDFEIGVKNLVTELQNQGYIAAKASSTRLDFDAQREFITIHLNIDEGPQTFIHKINFKGIKTASVPELEELIGLKANTPLQLNLLEESTNRMIEYYRSKGYLEARIANLGKNIVTYSTDNTKATIDFDIIEGPLISVGSIIIEGNTFTKDYVIRRELQFSTGEILTPEKIGYSEQKLQRLSLFTAIDIRTIDPDPDQGVRTVLVRVVEHDPGVFKSGIGVNNELDLSLRGFLGSAYRNLFGTGRAITARIEVNDKLKYNFIESDITLGYLEPFVFGTSNTGRLNLTRSRKIFSIDKVQEQVFAVDSSLADLLLERDLTRHLKLIYEVLGLARTNQFEINEKVNSKPLDIGTTGPTFLYDNKDDQFNPTRGIGASYSIELGSPYLGSTQTVNYYKTIASLAGYIPMGKVVLANEGRAGYMKNISNLDDSLVPQTKTFALGGRSTVRGFNPATEIFPSLNEYKNLGDPTNGGLKQEAHFLLYKSELRVPLVGNLGIAFFYDGGTVVIPRYQPQFAWRDSVGIGFRYITPVGPVSLEYGHKLNRDDTRGEGSGFIHFSIGVF